MRPLLPLLFAVVCACGTSSSNDGTPDGGGASSSSGSSSGGSTSSSGGGDGGNAVDAGNDTGPTADAGIPTLSCTDDNVTTVAGTWDLVTSNAGGQSTATLLIDANDFVFSSGGESLAFAINGGTPSLTWHEGTTPTALSVSRTGAAVDTGLIPLSIGGDWQFASMSDAENCTASLGAGAFTATCAQARTPLGTFDGTLSATRTAQLTSIFGEFGGNWHVTGSGGSDTVDVTFTGSTYTAVVNGTDWVTIKVCNGMLTGKTSAGFEIAGVQK